MHYSTNPSHNVSANSNPNFNLSSTDFCYLHYSVG